MNDMPPYDTNPDNSVNDFAPVHSWGPQETAAAIVAGKFSGMGVTNSDDGEYTSSVDVLVPLP